ncbi:glycosyltransferase, partial [Clostridium perfringens]|uniref:glycosyltransferase n=1 Tax=Clostridium perfringens TaxID=1502 RepID=UPI002AC38D2B
NNIDIVLWHGAKAFFLHSLVSKKVKEKSLATVHSDFNNDFNNDNAKKIIFTKLSYIGLKSFNKYIAVSKVIQDIINENFKSEKIYIVRNSIDKNMVKYKLDITRENLGISSNEFLFVNVARLHPVKNQMTLLKGFNILISKYKDCKMLIVGDGSERATLEKYIIENNLQNSILM